MLFRSVPTKIKDLVKEREEARKKKNWTKADLIRDQIMEMGWIIEDTPGGFSLKSILEK